MKTLNSDEVLLFAKFVVCCTCPLALPSSQKRRHFALWYLILQFIRILLHLVIVGIYFYGYVDYGDDEYLVAALIYLIITGR